MSRKTILHMLTPLRQMSPFDVNMALDAGYDAVVPYTDVTLSDVGNLVQDAIFSRPPDAGLAYAGSFCGSRYPLLLDDGAHGTSSGKIQSGMRDISPGISSCDDLNGRAMRVAVDGIDDPLGFRL